MIPLCITPLIAATGSPVVAACATSNGTVMSVPSRMNASWPDGKRRPSVAAVTTGRASPPASDCTITLVLLASKVDTSE